MSKPSKRAAIEWASIIFGFRGAAELIQLDGVAPAEPRDFAMYLLLIAEMLEQTP